MLNLENIKNKSLQKKSLTIQECEKILDFPDNDILLLLHSVFQVRKHFTGNKVQVQMLMNAKSGFCSEDCHYCSQSCISKAEIEKYPLNSTKKLVEGAKKAKKNNAIRYCMALSNVRYSDKIIDTLTSAIKQIKKEVGISVCCSLGFLTEKQAEKLKKAGLDRINHNLNTSKKHYSNICTTHKYEERIKNIKLCQDKGLEICCGGIIGLGESREDVIDMLLALKKINPESIPLNFLIPIKGTPLENGGKDLSPQYCLKVLCLARFLHPDKDIRVAGGREYRLRTLQPLALYPANSIFVSGYLTTDGQLADEGIQMIKDMGFELEIEGIS
ncbi:biotin synthase BioB [Pseudomonadota bacterium]